MAHWLWLFWIASSKAPSFLRSKENPIGLVPQNRKTLLPIYPPRHPHKPRRFCFTSQPTRWLPLVRQNGLLLRRRRHRFTTTRQCQVNQTGCVATKNMDLGSKKSKGSQESHFARRLGRMSASTGLVLLDRLCSWRASARDDRNPPPNSGSPRPQPSSLESGFWFSQNIGFDESPISPSGQSHVRRRRVRVSSFSQPRFGYSYGRVVAIVLRVEC